MINHRRHIVLLVKLVLLLRWYILVLIMELIVLHGALLGIGPIVVPRVALMVPWIVLVVHYVWRS